MAASFYQKVSSKQGSICAIAIVFIVHGVVILFLVDIKHIRPSLLNPSLQMIQLKPRVVESVLIVELPFIDFYPQINYPTVPDVEFDKVDHTDTELVQSTSDKPYELPNKNNTRYKNVFDPKLQKKLIDAQNFNTPRRVEKPTSWTEADGRTFVDMGDGDCLVSMSKVDSRDRGTNWGMTHCGKNNSEKMMDNVNADLNARKHPLH